MKCPSCGSEAQSGKFCSECGAALRAGCPSCGAEAVAGARFCTQCGEAVGARGVRGPGRTGWVIAAVALVVVVLVLMLPRRADRAGPPIMTSPAGEAPGAGGAGAGAPGMLSDDMRTNADRLFNRIMTAAEAGDRAEVSRFMPMAVQAYEMVEDLDDDGLYHLAILHRTGGEHEEAIRTAERILAGAPDHVLALGVAGQAAAQLGDTARARGYYRRLLDGYATEAARPLPEYLDHQGMLPEYRRAAREFLGEA